MARKYKKSSVYLTDRHKEETDKIRQEHGVSLAFLIRRGLNLVIPRYLKKEKEKEKSENNN
jgi:hypothetical protein